MQATQKRLEGCPSNQVSAAAITSASDEKWRAFKCFFQSGRAKDLSARLYTRESKYTFCLELKWVPESLCPEVKLPGPTGLRTPASRKNLLHLRQAIFLFLCATPLHAVWGIRGRNFPVHSMIKIIIAEHDFIPNLTVAILEHPYPTKLERTCFPGFENEGTASIPAAGLGRVVRTVCTKSENFLPANGC